MSAAGFYGPAQAAIHDERFGDLARAYALRLRDLLEDAGRTGGTVVDLGCGSGILAADLGAAGYDVVGVDVSADMLAIARHRAPAATFVQASVWDVDLPPAVAIAATGEVLGYLGGGETDDAALGRFFARAADALGPGGVLAFDLPAPGRGGPTGERQQFVDSDTWALHMRATEFPEQRSLRREITLFWGDGDCYRRAFEVHELRLRERAAVEALLRDAGLEPAPIEDLPGPPDGWFALLGRKGG